MTDITEHAIGRALYRHGDLDALYRACPTAFWLAPDGDGVLPTPGGPMLDAPAPVSDPAREPPDHAHACGFREAIGYGIVSAGPIFTVTAMTLDRTIPDASVWSAVARGLSTLYLFPLTMPFGAILALIPVLLGVLTLAAVGRTHLAFRTPALWAATGGAMGAGLATLFGAGGPVGLALVATSVLSARIARAAISWSDAEPA